MYAVTASRQRGTAGSWTLGGGQRTPFSTFSRQHTYYLTASSCPFRQVSRPPRFVQTTGNGCLTELTLSPLLPCFFRLIAFGCFSHRHGGVMCVLEQMRCIQTRPAGRHVPLLAGWTFLRPPLMPIRLLRGGTPQPSPSQAPCISPQAAAAELGGYASRHDRHTLRDRGGRKKRSSAAVRDWCGTGQGLAR